ncbi:AcrR family transcriptional regulator [Lipingzhangella halophila]|uniref:AcrR family transcriptional regulator n=1 Tax=Lipingzhangella halophila TaxID=1783352 RepID=A0A7W7RGW4_9ACTN|nr:TetR family transcriptional regulator C-terminal domain-containing protein [Lipingzhangella halophila]MBB4931750.1 AcrR family transcriptional regulator [Lipingzhangella halophila]
MPKIVDHEQRRRDLAEALWRVVAKAGPSAVSIRAVAAEAGWSAGALRHYFQTRDELLEFAIELAEEGITQRIQARAQVGGDDEPVLERAAAFIEELLPLDERRRAEFRIWQAVGEDFHQAHDEGDRRRWTAQRELYRSVALALYGDRSPDTAQREEWVAAWAAYLHVFCDGLAAQAMFAPARMPPDEARGLLRRFLADVARSAGETASAR